MRRTVKRSLVPRPRRPITIPEKTWIRSLSPSTTRVWTRTVSPTENSSGSLRWSAASIFLNSSWFIFPRGPPPTVPDPRGPVPA